MMSNAKNAIAILTGILFSAVFACSAFAVTVTWDGSDSTDWGTAANWDLNSVPLSDSDVVIPDATGTPNDPTVSAGAVCNNLTINSSGILNGGSNTLTVSGGWANSGTFNCDTGAVTFNGTGAKNINTGAQSFATATFNGSGSTWTLITNNLSAAAMNVTTGTLNVGSPAKTITVTGTLAFDGGTIASTGSSTVTITAGAISQTSGTISSASSITLDGTGDFQLPTITSTYSTQIGSTTKPSAVTINGVITVPGANDLYIYSNGNITQKNNISGGLAIYLYPDFNEDSNGQFVHVNGTITSSMGVNISQTTAVSLNTGFAVTGLLTIGMASSVTIDTDTSDTPTISATGSVTVNSNGNITVSAGSSLNTSANLTLKADYDNNLSGDISIAGTGSLPNGSALTYQQASTITYNNGLTNLTGCTTAPLSLTSTNGSVNITQATTGNSTITLYANGASNTIGNVTAGRLNLSKKNTDPTFTINDSSTINLTFAGTASGLFIGATVIVNAGAGTFITTGGEWNTATGGTFNGQTGTVTLNAATANKDVYMSTGSFNNLVINGAGSWRLNNNITVGGTLQVQAGTFGANAMTVTATGLTTISGGTYTASTAKQTFNGGLTISGGTLTASSGEVEVNGTLTVSSGTLTGSTGELDINGNVALSGTGILTAPSGTFGVSGNWTRTAGTFTPGLSIVTFDGTSGTQTVNSGGSNFYGITINNSGTSVQLLTNNLTQTAGGNLNFTQGTLDLNGLILTLGSNFSPAPALAAVLNINGGTFSGSGYNLTLVDNDMTITHTTGTITVQDYSQTLGTHTLASTLNTRDFSHTGGTFTCSGTPAINASGNVVITSAWTNTGSTITMSGASKTINASQTINNLTTTGSISINSSNNLSVNGAFNLSSGSFSQNAKDMNAAGSFTLVLGTTYTKGGTLTFNAGAAQTFTDSATQNIGTVVITGASTNLNMSSTLTADSISIQSSGTLTTGANTLDIGTGGITIAAGTTLTGTNGTITCEGNWDNNNIFTSTNSTLTMDGSTASATFEAGASNYNNIQINKTGTDANDNVTFQTDSVTINGALTITDGELIQQTALTTGAVTLSDATSKWTNITDADLTLSGNVSNTGTISFDAATASPDGIQIRSSASPTRRNWQGAGTFSMTDVDVRDQSCTGGTPANITVTSGTNSGNNINWLFGDGDTVSGIVYQNDRATNVGAGITVGMYIYYTGGSTATQTTTTIAGGIFSFTSLDLSAGDMVTLYIDNDGTYEGTTVIESNGGNATSVNLSDEYVNLISQNDNISNTELSNADSGDGDIHYSVAGGNLAVDSTYHLYINTGGTFTPAGNVTVDSANCQIVGTLTLNGAYTLAINTSGTLDIDGTLNLDHNSAAIDVVGAIDLDGNLDAAGFSPNINVAGEVDFTNGTFTCGSSTVTFDGTGAKNINTGGQSFATATFNGSGSTWTLITNNLSAATTNVTLGTLNVGASKTITVTGTLTIDGGTITGTAVNVFITAGAISQTSGTISATGGSSYVYLDGAGDFQLGTITAAGDIYIGTTTKPSAVTINGVITAMWGINIYSNGNITQKNNLIPSASSISFYPDFDEDSNGQFVYVTGTIGGGSSGLNIYQKTAVALNTGFAVTGTLTIGASATYTPSSVTIDTDASDTPAISATGTVAVNSNGDITVSAGSALNASSTLTLTADYDNNLSGDISIAGTASLPANSTLFYQQASTITYNNGLTGITGCTTGSARLTSTNGSVNITQATTGNSSIWLYANGASNTIGNVTAGSLRLYKKNTNPTFTINDGSTISLTTAGTSTGLTIDATVTLNAGAGTFITTAAEWTNSGTFNGQTGTVTLNGATANKHIHMTAGSSFYNLIINGAGSWLLQDNFTTIGGTLQVQTGTFNANAMTVTATGLATISGGTYTASTAKQTLNGGLTISGGTLTASSGEVEVNGTLTISSGTLTGSTGVLDINGNVTLSGTGILTAPSGSFTVSGSWTRTGGTFTPGLNTVTLNGTTQSDITGTNTFYNLTIDTNADGAKTVRFGASQTQTISNTLSITGAAGKVLTIRSTVDETQGTISIPASITTGVDYVNVKDSKVDDASYTITAGSNSTNSGNNTNWLFGTNTISGTVYTDDNEVTPIISTAVTVVVYSGGIKSTYITTSSNPAGTYTITNGTLADNDIICVYLNTGGATKGTAVYRVGGSGSVSGLNVYQNHLVVFNADSTNMTNDDLYNVDDSDADVIYSVSAASEGNLTVDNNIELFLEGSSAKTFAPGGNIIVQGTGDLKIESGATLSMAAKDLTVGDDIVNNGTISQTATGTTTLNGATKTISGAPTSTTFYNLTVAGTYTLQQTATVSGTTTVNGTKSLAVQGVTLNANTINNSGTITLDGTTAAATISLDNTAVFTNSSVVQVTNSTNTCTIQADAGGTASFSTTDIDYNGNAITLSRLTYNPAVSLGTGGTNNESITLGGAVTFANPIVINGLAAANTFITTGTNILTAQGSITNTKGTITITAGGGSIAAGANAIDNQTNGVIANSGSITCGDFTNAGTYSNPAVNTINSSGNVVISSFGGTTTNNTLTMSGVTKTINASAAIGNLTISGTIAPLTNILTVNGIFTINGGATFDNSTANLDINVKGNWANSGDYKKGTETVTLNGTSAQTVTTGGSSFNTLEVTNASDYVTFNSAITCANFTAQTASSKMKFKESANFTVTGTLTLNGQASGTEIELISALDGTQWNLVSPAAIVNFVKVKDSNCTNGSVTAASSMNLGGNDDSDPVPHWIFVAVTRYWVGVAGGDWDDNNNWSSTSGGAGGAGYPQVGDTAIFDGNDVDNCLLDANVSVAVIELQGASDPNGAYTGKLDAGGFDITTTSTVEISNGELELDASSDLTVGGTLTVSGGTFDGLSGTIDTGGTVSITGGELIAPSGNFNVAGNWAHTGGTFTNSSGTIILDTAGLSTISGNTTFYNLNCMTPGKQINFTAGTNQTVNNTLTLTGADGNLITLRSTIADNKWDITLAGGVQTVSYVDVKDSNANTNIVTCYNSVNSNNNNANWIFSALSITFSSAGTTAGQNVTIIGTAGPGNTVIITGTVGGIPFQQVASVIADANGNYRVMQSDYTANLDVGANSIRAEVGAIQSAIVNIIVVATPNSNQTPTITSPAEGSSVRGNRPTITGTGLAGQTVTLTVNDKDGNLLLTDVATTTVDAEGNWTISGPDYTTALAKGINYLSVTVAGVASDIRSVSLVDPFGVVFDSVSNNLIGGVTVTIYNNATGNPCTPGVEIAATDVNPQITGTDGAYGFLCAPGNYYITVSASGYGYPSAKTTFPDGRTIVTGSKGEIFTVAGAVLEIDHPMDSNALLLKIEKNANKKEVSVGGIVTYTITIENQATSDVTSVYLEDNIPAGFKYLNDKVILDGTAISEPTGNRPLTFNIGTVPVGSTLTLKYQLVVGSGFTFGKYKNSAFAKYSDGTVISNTATETVEIILDPLFDLGTVIGKVFWDWDENGVQRTDDRGQKSEDRSQRTETGIPNVRIVMENGTVVITDRDGKYHVPGVTPGRHAFRLDESTLPEGSYLTTPKVVIADIRPGLTSKINFGASSENQKQKAEDLGQKLPVNIIQERGSLNPRLNVALNKETLELQLGGGLKESATFRIFTNYALFIDKWNLDIFDKTTGKLFKRFNGDSLTLSKPIIWDGTDDIGNLVKTERSYMYVLTVWDKEFKSDKTKEREFKVLRSEENAASKKEALEKEIFGKTVGDENEKEFWLLEKKTNNLDSQTIKLDGDMVTIKGNTFESEIKTEDREEQAENRNQVTVNVIQGKGLETPRSLSLSESSDIENFEQDIIVPKGEHTIIVEAQNSNGETTEYTKDIKVSDNYFFFIAMGDGEMGYNFSSGDTEPVGDDDQFKEGLWVDGKLAYYLQAKIKGKYLITSSLDTERDQKELFKYIDPDKYYPVYGDNSQLSYEAADTQGMLYALIEWDRSEVLWGNYNVTFDDTEFARFSRTLYGGKVQLISVSDTKFGEPRTKIIAFTAKASQKAAHNEFTGTGGSLYYLKHRHVVEGSDKIKIEIRDKITGLVLSELEQKEGSDYQIDYDNGRIIFWKPVSQIAESESIISTHLLDGNNLYIVADYEYYPENNYEEWSQGARISQSLGDYLRVGGTYVKDSQEAKKDFELKAVDTTVRLNKDIRFDAEYAESSSENGSSFISTDGGLNFSALPTDENAKGEAYGISGEAKLFDKLSVSSYYKKIEKGFSTPSTLSNQGTEKIGGEASFEILPGTQISARHDIQKLLDDGNLESQAQIGAEKTETTTARLQSQLSKKLEATVEYQHQKVSGEKDEYEAETNENTDVIAGRLAYKPTDKLKLSLEHQQTLKGEQNQQVTAGAEAKVNKYVSLRASETVGTKGNATTIGAGANIKDRLDIFTDYTFSNEKEDGQGKTATVGSTVKVDDNSSVYNTYSISDSDRGQNKETIVFGTKEKLDNGYETSFGRELSRSGKEFASANIYGVAKEVEGRKIEGTFKEETADEDGNVSHTNIFGLSGDINDKWAANFDLEKGKVQNLDGTQTERTAVSGGASYVNKDRITLSSKLEYRYDESQENSRQILTYNAVEGKVTRDLTLFGKANISETLNTSADSTDAAFKEIVLGAAYRPVHYDRLNLIGKYTLLEDNSPASQNDSEDIEKTKANVFGLEAIYDLTDKIQIAEKGAYKQQEEKVSGFDFTKTQTWLLVNRLNYNLTRDWQIGGEYRVLKVVQAEDMKQGALLEVSRRIGEFMRVGTGYNFTDFSDDLTDLDYTVQGPFVRITGTLYDRTPQEVERLEKKELEKNIESWAWELVNNEMAKPESAIRKELNTYFELAKIAQDEGRLKEAKELYEKISEAGRRMYGEALEYIRGRVELEKRLKNYYTLASIYYKEGKLTDAKELWKKIITESNPPAPDKKGQAGQEVQE